MADYVKLRRNLSKIKSNIRARIRQNETLLKYLLYDDSDPLSHPITEDQIDVMFREVLNGEPIELSKQKVFRTQFVRRSDNETGSQLRIFTHSTKKTNEFQYDVRIGADIITHTDIDVINNENRSDILFALVCDCLDGFDVEVAAPLEVVKNWSIEFMEYKTNYIGVRVIFNTTVAV